MSADEARPDDPLVEPLTRRESEILGLLDQGFSAPEMAEQLTLAVSSVKWHIRHLYEKLGVNGKRPALNRARALGLLNTPLPPAGRAPAPASPPKHNLPLQVTRFFGREAEIDQLQTRLAKHRLVTLTGSGGVGKTRLSLAAAEALLPDFADGVWLTELAPLTDPALVPQQVAASLGVRDQSGQPMVDALTQFLRERQVLLVLDNCEHLLAACAQLADAILRACPRVRLLATSREPLGVAGEAVFAVSSLSFPDAEHLPPLDQMANYTAINLLLDRARLVLPDYQATAGNAAALARICQRLDGIPLALEMAAARLNILKADQLASRLDAAFRLLTGGSRSALPRQQTLRATLDWSYQLLGEAERLLFQRLAVFAGGCTLEAAEAVCADTNLPAADILDLLASLVAKSLVIADRALGAEARYHLQEVTRQYAREKLIEGGDTERLRSRHRDYFIVAHKTNIVTYSSSARQIAIRRLKVDLDNLRQTLEWSFSDWSDVETGPRLVSALPDVWSGVLSHQENLEWHIKAVAWCESHLDVSRGLYASLLSAISHLVTLNDPQAALPLAQQAVTLSRALGPDNKENLVWDLQNLGWLYMEDLADAEQARPIYAEAETILHEVADGYSPADYQTARAWFAFVNARLAHREGQYQAAKTYADESVQLYQRNGDHWAPLRPLLMAGQACLSLGEYDLAHQHILAALSLIDETGDLQKANALRWLADVDARQKQWEQALRHSHESLREALKMPDRNVIASDLGLAALIAAAQGQPARAATLSGASAALWARQKRQPWEDSSLDTLLPGWQAGPDAAAISAAFAAGQAMSVDEAMDYALNDGHP